MYLNGGKFLDAKELNQVKPGHEMYLNKLTFEAIGHKPFG